MPDEQELLKRGIASARSGDKETARGLLLETTLLNPNNENAWLWLAQITDNPSGKISYLKRALTINPEREATQTALKGVQMQEAIAQARAGYKENARRLLLSVIDADPNCQPAWLWLASVASSNEDAKQYLERAVQLNPDNQNAVAWLEKLRKAPPSPIFPVPPKPPVEGFVKLPAPAPSTAETISEARQQTDSISSALEIIQERAPEPESRTVSHNASETVVGSAFVSQTESLSEPSGVASTSTMVVEAEPPVNERGVILAVDDSLIIRRAVATTLEKEGFCVVSAEDGMKALSMLNETSPDVILLDIAMPMMDGYEVCKLIRRNPAFKHIPVVMLSGKDGFFDKVKGKLAGSTEYLTKPFEPEKLIKTVDKHCQRQKRMNGASTDRSIYGFAR